MKIMKRMMACALAVTMFVIAGSAAFAASKSATSTDGYTKTLDGKSCTFKVNVKSGNKGAGTLYLKDPFLWHQWDYKYYSNGGSYSKSYPNVGSSSASWRGFAENSTVTITVS